MPRDYLHDPWNNWFVGAPSNQYFSDYYLWEVFFSTKPMKHLIELGTWHGGMSTYLATQCYSRNIGFDTFDVIDMPGCFNRPLQKMLGLLEHFHKGNIFEENFELVKNIIETSPRPFTLFCDDGNKVKEYQTFYPFLKPGDFCVIHDWGHEVFERDLIYENREQLLVEQSEVLKTMTIFLRVT